MSRRIGANSREVVGTASVRLAALSPSLTPMRSPSRLRVSRMLHARTGPACLPIASISSRVRSPNSVASRRRSRENAASTRSTRRSVTLGRHASPASASPAAAASATTRSPICSSVARSRPAAAKQSGSLNRGMGSSDGMCGVTARRRASIRVRAVALFPLTVMGSIDAGREEGTARSSCAQAAPGSASSAVSPNSTPVFMRVAPVLAPREALVVPWRS